MKDYPQVRLSRHIFHRWLAHILSCLALLGPCFGFTSWPKRSSRIRLMNILKGHLGYIFLTNVPRSIFHLILFSLFLHNNPSVLLFPGVMVRQYAFWGVILTMQKTWKPDAFLTATFFQTELWIQPLFITHIFFFS